MKNIVLKLEENYINRIIRPAGREVERYAVLNADYCFGLLLEQTTAFFKRSAGNVNFKVGLKLDFPKMRVQIQKDPQNFIMDLNVLDLAKLQMKTQLIKTGLATNP